MDFSAQIIALHTALAAACPIAGVSVDNWSNVAGTATVWYQPSATAAQKTACQAILSTYVVPPDPVKPMRFLDFINLFTPAEQQAIASAADAQVKILALQLAGQGTISFSDPRLKAGLDYLVAQGLLTLAREAQVLAGQPHP